MMSWQNQWRRCVFVKFLQITRDFQFLKELKSTYFFGSFLHPLMCLKETTDRTALFSTKKTGTTSPDPSSKQGALQNGDGKVPHEVCEKQQKKVFQLVMGRARKPDPRRCFFKNFVVTYQPPPLLGHQVSGRFGGENERMWVKGHSIKSHGFLKVYHLEHLEPTFLIYFRVLCGYASVVLRGSQKNRGEGIPLPNFWKNIQVEPALSSTGRNHLNFTVVDPCCARSHSCTRGCTRCVRMMMGFLPSKNLTKMMILQQCWWGFRMIFLSSHVFHMFSLLRGWHCFNAIMPSNLLFLYYGQRKAQWKQKAASLDRSGIQFIDCRWSPKRPLIQRELPLDFSFCQLQMSKFYQICLCF